MVVDPMERLGLANPEPWCPPPPIDEVWRRIEADGRVGADRVVARLRRPKTMGRWRRSLGGATVALSSVVVVVIAVAAIALLSHGREESPTAPRALAIHVDGHRAKGSYVFETVASGARFLVPASLLAAQGSRPFDVATPTRVTVGEKNDTVGAPPTYRAGVASAEAVVPHSAHVELLVTGAPGRRFALSWEETCGWTQHGKAAAGGTGGEGLEIQRSPAVTLVKLPRINGGVPDCYVAAAASTTSFTRGMRLAIIDY